jgi:hypothetical protein
MTSLIPTPSTALITEEPPPLRPANKAAIFDALEAAGIAYVEVPFNGSGDEGFVGEPTAYINNGSTESPQYTPTTLPSLMIPWQAMSIEGQEIIEERNLSDALDAATWDCTYATSCGWQDNDGAEGTVTFQCDMRTIEVEMAEFYTATNSRMKIF